MVDSSGSKAARLIGAALLSGVLATSAWARPGDHIRAGDAVIVPDIDLGMEYRTNIYRREDRNPPGGANLRVAPGIEIRSAGPELEFSVSGEYELRKYFKQTQTSLDRFTDFDFAAALKARKKQAVGVDLRWISGLRNNPTQAWWTDSSFHTQFHNDLDGFLVIRPGPALEFELGGGWAFDDFRVPESGTGDGTRGYDRRNSFGPRVMAKWTFFPRTALVADFGYDWLVWQDNWVSASGNVQGEGLGDNLAMPDSQHMRALAGIRGRFTRQFVLTTMLGYGTGSYDEQSVLDEAGGGGEADPATVGFDADVRGIERLLVEVQGTYELTPDNKLIGGYRKAFADSWFTNYLAYNHLYAKLLMRVGPRLSTEFGLSARFEGYHGEISRNDIYLRGRADASYHFQDWGAVTAGIWWDERASNTDIVEYDDFNFHLLTTFTY